MDLTKGDNMKQILKITALLILASQLVKAEESTSRPDKKDRKKFHQAIKQCADDLDLELPERGSGERLDKADKDKLDACLVAKGIEPPKHRFKHRGPPPEDSETENSNSESKEE